MDISFQKRAGAAARHLSFAQRAAEYLEMSGPGEFIAAGVLLTVMMLIRVVNITRYNFDSDEPQHLHVIWGWTRGLVQYRDLFDNHMPLFHIMFAPIMGIIGEHAFILYVMRLLLLPMYFVAAWCTYHIGAALFSKRVGIWAVIFAGLYARYHLTSIEFRPDNVWAPLWLLCITVLVTGPLNVRRSLVAGLCLGLCFGISMKSVLFLLSIALAAPLTLLLVGRRRLGESWGHLARCAAAFLISTFIVPLVIMGFFATKGVWRDFRYCVFDFNLLAPAANQHPLFYQPRVALLVAILVFMFAYIVWQITLVPHNPGLAFRRGFVFIVLTSYFLVLKFSWPLQRHDSDPPFYPLALLFFCGGLFAVLNALPSRKWGGIAIRRWRWVPACLAVAEIVVLISMEPMWKDRTRAETDSLRTTLALLAPNDYVLDLKGETIFRTRCTRPVFEAITRSAIEHRLLVDNAPNDCVRTRTCAVATRLMNRFPRDTRQFVKRNYLPVTDTMRVAGRELKVSATNPHHWEFNVTIPAMYEIISPGEYVSGLLDGVPYEGARFVPAGPHTFESSSMPHQLTLVWAQAVARHFTPLAHHSSSKG